MCMSMNYIVFLSWFGVFSSNYVWLYSIVFAFISILFDSHVIGFYLAGQKMHNAMKISKLKEKWRQRWKQMNNNNIFINAIDIIMMNKCAVRRENEWKNAVALFSPHLLQPMSMENCSILLLIFFSHQHHHLHDVCFYFFRTNFPLHLFFSKAVFHWRILIQIGIFRSDCDCERRQIPNLRIWFVRNFV